MQYVNMFIHEGLDEMGSNISPYSDSLSQTGSNVDSDEFRFCLVDFSPWFLCLGDGSLGDVRQLQLEPRTLGW